ncbi:hypothetical protein BBJ28_00007797 [Nothophytophthora sp. Chile5]|nr:hypothetical protein BBJ28_00007797 [Nothophytophthora sp. Chile5]
MADVHGGLLKCVLQLAACSDKLRTTDELLGKVVSRMQSALPASGMPHLGSKLAVVPANPDRDTRTREEKFQELFDQGTALENTAHSLGSGATDWFRDLVKSRNTDIQEEYARMLKELDDQTESLDREIAQEREVKAASTKRHHDEALVRKANKRQRLEAESAQLKTQLDEFTSEIRQLQGVFATLEKEDAGSHDHEASPDDAQSAEERRAQDEERAENEIVELQQEIVLLKEAQDAIAAKNDTRSLKAQYEEEKQEVIEETVHVSIFAVIILRGVLEDLTPQINSNGVRLHSLLRTLAPSAGIGTLMTRLYQQLSTDSTGRASTGSNAESPPPSSSSRKTVDLRTFLNVRPTHNRHEIIGFQIVFVVDRCNCVFVLFAMCGQSCPTMEEGKQAIGELKKLQLIHCYESSGIIALAD